VANKREYLDRLHIAIQELHTCGAIWRESVPVHEVFPIHSWLGRKRGAKRKLDSVPSAADAGRAF